MDIPPIDKLKPRKSHMFLAFFVLLFLISDIAYANTVTATIVVGDSPRDVAVDEDSDLIYVPNLNDDTVSVINGTTNTVIETITVGDGPQGIAVDGDSDLIYVTNTLDNTVSVINGTTNTVIGAPIGVGNLPIGVAVDYDSNLIYVTNEGDGAHTGNDTVSVINGTTNMVIQTITVGNRPVGIAVDYDDNLIYVGNRNDIGDSDDNTVSVINGATNTVTATISVNAFDNIAVDYDDNLIYVADRQNDTVSVINGATNTVTQIITLGNAVVGVAVDSDSNLIYVTDRQVLGGIPDAVFVIDNNNNNLISTGGGGDYRHKTSPTSGLDWNTFEQIVKEGFTVNGKSIDITDNWHTDFEKQKILIGKINLFSIKTYAQNNGLLFQEIAFGIPEIGKYQNAETVITVWYNHDKSIKDVTIKQDRGIIDSSSLQILTSQIPCGYVNSTCYQTDIYAIFNEPLQYDIFAIYAVDMSRRSMNPTYLNEGFDISGYSLNPLETEQIPGPDKYEGLITVTQIHPLSNLWGAEDGRIFEMWGESNSFKLVYQPTENEYYDTGSIKDRNHSAFDNWKQLQIYKSQKYFDSEKIQRDLPNSFRYEYPDTDSRTKFLIEHELLEHARK